MKNRRIKFSNKVYGVIMLAVAGLLVGVNPGGDNGAIIPLLMGIAFICG